MRPYLLGVLAIQLLGVTSAAAEENGGGQGSGGGALSKVSAGVRDAGGGRSGGGGGGGSTQFSDDYRRYDDRREVAVYTTTPVVYGAEPEPLVVTNPTERAKVDLYVGAQKVHDSDGSVSAELAIVDRRFRLGGALTHYFESLEGGGRLTMTMPSLMLGLRLDDNRGGTRAFVEGGVVHASTKADPVMDSSITGAILGVRFEHSIAQRTRLIADAHVLDFEHDIRAYEGRIGIRLGNLQGSFRVLDFNVGPALYGPELGLAF